MPRARCHRICDLDCLEWLGLEVIGGSIRRTKYVKRVPRMEWYDPNGPKTQL